MRNIYQQTQFIGHTDVPIYSKGSRPKHNAHVLEARRFVLSHGYCGYLPLGLSVFSASLRMSEVPF